LSVSKAKIRSSARQVEALLTEKTLVLSKAQALATMGLSETAQTLWASAASYEERIASLLDAHGDQREAAVHRISAASCYQKAGDPSRATNLYRAALAGRYARSRARTLRHCWPSALETSPVEPEMSTRSADDD
jgi:uncharacterized protein HemY